MKYTAAYDDLRTGQAVDDYKHCVGFIAVLTAGTCLWCLTPPLGSPHRS